MFTFWISLHILFKKGCWECWIWTEEREGETRWAYILVFPLLPPDISRKQYITLHNNMFANFIDLCHIVWSSWMWFITVRASPSGNEIMQCRGVSERISEISCSSERLWHLFGHNMFMYCNLHKKSYEKACPSWCVLTNPQSDCYILPLIFFVH